MPILINCGVRDVNKTAAVRLLQQAARALCLLCIVVGAQGNTAEQVLRSSVSPEFRTGLHAKYLAYIARKLDSKLDIYPMPFARRVDALKQGKIDVMVGLKRAYKPSGFVYLEPAYEALRNSYFVRAKNADRLRQPGDIASLTVAVTIDNPASRLELEGKYRAVMRVSSLEQKIRLLHHDRIDAFLHFESSARLTLAELGLADDIVAASFQPGTVRNYHVGLSTTSPFFERKNELEQIIRQGVSNGDFAAIRLAHEIASAQ